MLPPPRVNPQIKKYLKNFRPAADGGRAFGYSPLFTRGSGGFGRVARVRSGRAGRRAGARWAEFTPVKWANAEAVGMVILAIWPMAKSAIEARPCTDSAGKCPPGVKLSGQGWSSDQPAQEDRHRHGADHGGQDNRR